MAQLPDYYAVLGISRYATQDEIAQKYHELLGQNPSEAQREKIDAAFEVLSDQGKRQRYDFDQSIARIRGSYSDYVDEVIEDADAASGERGTRMDDLMAQSRQSFDQFTASLDDLLPGAEAISGQSGSARDDLIADSVDVTGESATTLDDLFTKAEQLFDQIPPDEVRSRHPAAIRLPDAPPAPAESAPRKVQVRRAGGTVNVPGTIRRRPPPRRKSSANKIPIIVAVLIMGISMITVMVANEVDDSSTVVIPTLARLSTRTPFRVSTLTTIPRSPTPILPTAAVTRIQSEGSVNDTARPEPTEVGPEPTELPPTSAAPIAFMVTLQPGDDGHDVFLETIMNAHQLGVPVDFSGHDLSDGVFPAVPLQNAILEGNDFHNANLNAADLQNANLREANLQGATLRKTMLQGADLTGANLTNALLTGAYFSTATVLPDGTGWTEDTDMARFTDPDHPDFWQGE